LISGPFEETQMPMREECKHYQSRTYSSGEVARLCSLDLAPEAPWRCPDGCPRYERRFADAGWTHGSLVEPAVEDEPDEDSESIGELLASADEIVNEVGPEVRAEFEAEQRRSSSWRRFLPRRGKA
jgi:hypothetical protein